MSSEFVVVANRLPLDARTDDDGTVRWEPSPGGLVTALEPLMRASGGAWVGWSGSATETPAPFDSGAMSLVPVALDADDVADYYEGFCNATIWPLYHDVVVPPEFHRHWWARYVDVNERFAAAAADVAAEGAFVWVHDYQLQLVPRLLRELRPDLRIGFFLHIPFPPTELFMQLPWRVELLDGLLGADLVGFQLPGGAANFRRLCAAVLGHRVSGEHVHVDDLAGTRESRAVRASAFPISIDAAHNARLAADPAVQAQAAALRADLGNPDHVVLGVDRLDYTKGIDIRLRAFEELLASGALTVPSAVFVQVATPSRERVEQYRLLRDDIERQVGRINGLYGTVGQPAVHYIHRSLPRDDLVALYLAADVMVVTPLRDGMNLVAKEYVASRVDDRGVLVLSEFTGAAHELRHALTVNPHDIDGVKRAVIEGLQMEPGERAERMRQMRLQVSTHDVQAWADSFVAAMET